MFRDILGQIKTACILLILMTLLTGLMYPLLVTGFGQFLLPWQANGSLLEHHGKYIGSALIGQSFSSPGLFMGRPSATHPVPYNGSASSGSNLGPLNPVLLEAVRARVERLKALDAGNTLPVPVELVTASGSGLDPEISPAAALYQIPRIARARNVSEASLVALVEHYIQGRSFYLLGEPRVNVLRLNLALDGMGLNDEKSTPKP